MISQARDIALRAPSSTTHEVSKSITSPNATSHSFTSPPSSYGGGGVGLARTPTTSGSHSKQLMTFATEDIKVLLLENVNKTGRDALEKQGYQVEFQKGAMGEDELVEKIKYVLL